MTWNFSNLSDEIDSGFWFLAECPVNVLFKEKKPEFWETSVEPLFSDVSLTKNFDPPIEYDFSIDKSDDLWKRLLCLMGGEYVFLPCCIEDPEKTVRTQEE